MDGALSQPVLETIPQFCRKWRIKEFSLFGSALRPDFRPDSDVDCLVEFEDGVLHGIDEWIGMRDELETLLKRRVDLVSKASLRNPFRRSEILKTRKVIYSAAA